jgi:2-polyprenyl-3-methyl-5-hydroxy-6-metoxy-1,4-benzoquinol methylase
MTIPDAAYTHERLAETFDAVMNPYDIQRRLEVLIDEMLADVDLAGLKVLEAGCGTGRGAERLKQRGASVTVLDLGPTLVQIAVGRTFGAGVVASVDSIPFASSTFDIVFSTEVIEHTPDPLAAVAEMWRVLGPGGRLVISTPNHLWKFPVWFASKMRLRPYDGLENFLRPRDLRQSIQQLPGAQILAHRGIHLFPFQFTPLHGVLKRFDRFGTALLPVMINQAMLVRKVH